MCIRDRKYVTPTVGLPTLTDIIQELDKPGRDPRQQIQVFEFDKNVKTIEDLSEGMELPGIVNNITNFGCFVDISWKYGLLTAPFDFPVYKDEAVIQQERDSIMLDFQPSLIGSPSKTRTYNNSINSRVLYH